ncbi:sodium-dependent transporter [Natronorubrum daqingense]|uniref:Daunorubicin ABC transporter ATP-binding protein n=1 Tax=Natronorubrum daqingense TaxID=588898 RepID=A0A1N6ZMG8_9EURY|nr:sodium-dependent transporter [Natronorubrum daqingense]APX95308.1 daunorubicin ABC transporter ATP-binding protein [Natronorubrum daqingense]SIR27994.1 neurotransmitter:Na+ symporter, NSS family [Natronorubrum daqingense]
MSSGGQREQWATRIGFIFAAVGSAVGLGNIWRFPFQVGQEGGAAFLVIYLLFIVLIGFPAMLIEFVVGRHTERNPVGALQEIGAGAWRYVGWIFIATGFVILSYYSVVAGWTIRYTLLGLQDDYIADAAEAEAQFVTLASGLDAIFLHAIFMVAVIAIVAYGIERGIELAVKVMIPAIIVIMLGLAVYVATLEGASEAYSYYLSPEWGVIAAEWQSILPAAAGQAFFTLSLGMGVMITYASYLGEDRNLAEDSAIIIGFDTAIAFVTGLIVFPVLFTAGVAPGDPGAGAIFVSLAAAFGDLTFGWLIGAIFFATVAIAALSSAISLMEVVVSYAIDELDLDRVTATLAIGGAIFLLGIPSAYDLVLLDLFDLFADQILLVLGGLLLAILVSWSLSTLAIEELERGIGDLGSLGTAWIWAVRIPVVLVLVVALVLGILDYYEFLSGDFAAWLEE